MRKHPGATRVLGFANHADAGTYADCIKLARLTGTTPDITATRHPGTLKYGLGFNADQEIAQISASFRGFHGRRQNRKLRVYRNRPFEYGRCLDDRHRWRRPFDNGATELTVSGLSGIHASYLVPGAHDFLLGDGRLQYGPEYVWESYYSARLFHES